MPKSERLRALVVMVNDYPERVVLFDPRKTSEAALSEWETKIQVGLEITAFHKNFGANQDPFKHPQGVTNRHIRMYSFAPADGDKWQGCRLDQGPEKGTKQ